MVRSLLDHVLLPAVGRRELRLCCRTLSSKWIMITTASVRPAFMRPRLCSLPSHRYIKSYEVLRTPRACQQRLLPSSNDFSNSSGWPLVMISSRIVYHIIPFRSIASLVSAPCPTIPKRTRHQIGKRPLLLHERALPLPLIDQCMDIDATPKTANYSVPPRESNIAATKLSPIVQPPICSVDRYHCISA